MNGTNKSLQAIYWAIEQKVDVISISWIIKEPFPELLMAVEAAARNALVICSTADEGAWSGEVYPADSESMIKVAATDKYGNLSPKSDKCAVNIAVPGENIPAFGPCYMGAELAASKISGSSVATALAAGVASLALLLLQVFNEVDGAKLRADGRFYTNKGMAQVLSRLNSSASMSTLFPTDSNDLPDLWNLPTLEKWLKTELRNDQKK
jgi:subtilisin family serine protease